VPLKRVTASTRMTHAVEKGKNEPTEIFACAPAASGFV